MKVWLNVYREAEYGGNPVGRRLILPIAYPGTAFYASRNDADAGAKLYADRAAKGDTRAKQRLHCIEVEIPDAAA